MSECHFCGGLKAPDDKTNRPATGQARGSRYGRRQTWLTPGPEVPSIRRPGAQTETEFSGMMSGSIAGGR
jgi:hypothetical protein